jgi:hypothetical protein
MSIAAELSTLFSILHDGEIASAKGTAERLTLRIDCQYLAELFQPDFYFFYVELTNVSEFSFTSWQEPALPTTGVVPALAIILQEEFEIASAQVANGKAVISLLGSSQPSKSSGGNLVIDCQQITLFNQEKRVLTLHALQQAARGYWDQLRDKSS